MLLLSELSVVKRKKDLANIPSGKVLISTVNAHSYNVAQNDLLFAEALRRSDVVLPDGISIVYAEKYIYKKKIEKIAGYDLFLFEMDKLNEKGGKCMFMGSTLDVLEKIRKKVSIEYPKLSVETLSPPFKDELSDKDCIDLISSINRVQPDLLWIGLSAPKQEKWAFENISKLNIACHVGCIGAVFDFYADTKKRAPVWVINIGFEWLYRLCSEPKRLWKRYFIGNILFLLNIQNEYKQLLLKTI